MPFATHSNQSSGGFEQPFSQAGMIQVISPEMPNAIPTTLAASSTWSSGLIYNDGYRYLTVAVTSSQAGSILVNQYLDTAGTIARPTNTTTLTASTGVIVDITDLKPFGTYTISVVNSSTLASTLSGFACIMSAG